MADSLLIRPCRMVNAPHTSGVGKGHIPDSLVDDGAEAVPGRRGVVVVMVDSSIPLVGLADAW